MSSALALILAAAVTANGPEMVSAETVEQRLDLSGVWQMTFEANHDLGNVALVEAGSEFKKLFDIRDEGEGKVRLRLGGEWLLGIYRQERDSILISCASARDGRPTSFATKIPYFHIHFDRVKTGK